ncbi:MAG TPA: alpha-galactosidase [Bacteroidales bacterium]|nr:alpha-galactosidase [Bacteroidales bacterium]
MMKDVKSLTVIIVVLLVLSCSGPEKSIKLNELDLSKMKSGWRAARKDSSVAGSLLSIAGKRFESGIGTHAVSTFLIKLDKKGQHFSCFTGVDDGSGTSEGSVEFILVGDKKILWQSGIMKKGDSARKADVNIRGIDKLGLLVTDGNDGRNGDHADWADAVITYRGFQPRAVDNEYFTEAEEILTPPAPAEPRINGPKVYGVHPGSPFLYRIPATGERPMTFSAEGLPQELSLDENSGIITGKVEKAGEYPVELIARNSKGTSERPFKIIAGGTLALTPPMGWNSWYIYYHRVSDSVMRLSADLMITSGMADYGYQYVNIDDCWAIKANSDDPVIGGEMREKNGELKTNKLFPDMKALTDYIHAKGLKAGIYISPGPTTCAGYTGSYQHEQQDIRTFADWGFDFLKYDWCSYGRIEKERTREAFMKPYILMWNELGKIKRDIVMNLCQYGMGEVWEWGAGVGNCWRTTGDLGLVAGSSMPGFYYVGLSNATHWEYARPGGYNDPDYILIGWIRNALKSESYEKADLTPDEQYSYMSMWSLMAAPLIYGGEMARLDTFTLNILCNHEVIDVNQDVLGKQAKIVRAAKEELIMAKELEDGSVAVGLFAVSGDANSSIIDLIDNESDGLSDAKRELSDPADNFFWDETPSPLIITLNASDINISGNFSVRDLWRQKDLGIFENSFTTEVPFHGVKFIRITEVE